ncbi:MAG: GNAT family N-acetyltransferase [Coprobacillaceae bacterium]
MKISYTIATIENFDEIFNLFQASIKEMANNGIEQWDSLYPDKQTITNDIYKEELYIGTITNTIVVVFVINEEYDDAYNDVSWHLQTKKFKILHRLCVNPDFQNKGIAKITMKYIEEQLILKKIDAIRLDAFSNNPYALRLYHSLGFIIVGETIFRKGKFLLMEKILNQKL